MLLRRAGQKTPWPIHQCGFTVFPKRTPGAIGPYYLGGCTMRHEGADRKLNLLEFLEQKLVHLLPSRCGRLSHTNSVNKKEPPYGYGPWQDFNTGLDSFRQSLSTRTASTDYHPIRHREWNQPPMSKSGVRSPLDAFVLLSVNGVHSDGVCFHQERFSAVTNSDMGGDLVTHANSDSFFVPR